ncbi:hypothetical protein [Cellulomonas hominis]|uniref:hypothetical protein n=1 Tax=Cellulomonas hominis TaxID=156981 RepID=UPI001B99D7D9|nr:hypothetical protein [Cellulomonas hominis]VTR77227.1 hypothetical protein CHMI_01997 [Cellulomonas hominis]
MRVKRSLFAVLAVVSASFLASSPAIAADGATSTATEVSIVQLADGTELEMWGETPSGRVIPLETETNADGDVHTMDALGCTAAPGGIGAQNCVTVINSSPLGGTGFAYAISSYISASDNVCSKTAQFKYTDRTANPNKTATVSGSACSYGGGDLRWDPADFHLQHGSDFCARQKNSATGGVYANYACVRISA